MKNKIRVSVLLLVVIFAGFLIVENIRFNNYTSKRGTEMNIQVNQKAPVVSKNEIIISAPVDKVWNILIGIDNWPDWQKNVTEAKLDNEIKEGATFKWKAGGILFSSEIHTMKPKSMFGWTGKTFGASAIHNWTFDEYNGKTKVTGEESLQGVLPTLFKKNFQKTLDAGILKNLEELKTASEL